LLNGATQRIVEFIRDIGLIVAAGQLDEPGAVELAGDTRSAERLAQRHDLETAMSGLRPRDRAMLWLAYAHGSTHDEIAGVIGVKTGSVKLMLFRARQRLAERLRRRAGTSTETSR